MLESILTLDRHITLALNGSESLYADNIMMLITSTLTWIPVALVMIYIIIRNNELPQLLTIIAGLVLCVVISNGLSEICKAVFERPRPSNDPLLMYAVKVVNGYRESRFGFFSAHSANTMSVAVFLSLLFKKTRATMLIILWSLLNAWSRIYLGVHYFGDVITGLLVGLLVGIFLYAVNRRISRRFGNSMRRISSEYTRGGYLTADVDALLFVLLLTFAAISVIACVWPN